MAGRHHRVLIEVAQAQQDAEIIPPGVARALRVAGPPLPERWRYWEEELRHETAAFVAAQAERIEDDRARSLIYLGMTSSNLQDTSDAIVWTQILGRFRKLAALIPASPQNADGQRVGRTHGQQAEVVRVMAVYERFRRDLSQALERLIHEPLLASLGGPVGEYSPQLTPEIAELAAWRLGVELDLHPTQTASRHRVGVVAANLVHVIGACEQLATHHRLSAITEIGEFREGFDAGVQKGSSVMPHKRNPIRSERICGLARVARGHLAAILETANTQWWERDLTNSSVERSAFWSLVNLTAFILDETTLVLREGAVQHPGVAEIRSWSGELTRRVLDGQDREEAYRDLQREAHDD